MVSLNPRVIVPAAAVADHRNRTRPAADDNDQQMTTTTTRIPKARIRRVHHLEVLPEILPEEKVIPPNLGAILLVVVGDGAAFRPVVHKIMIRDLIREANRAVVPHRKVRHRHGGMMKRKTKVGAVGASQVNLDPRVVGVLEVPVFLKQTRSEQVEASLQTVQQPIPVAQSSLNRKTRIVHLQMKALAKVVVLRHIRIRAGVVARIVHRSRALYRARSLNVVEGIRK